MKQLLFPTDFSQNSWNAIQYGLSFFKNTPCTIFLLHVCSIGNFGANEYPLFPEEDVIDITLLKQNETALKELVQKIKEIDTNPNHNFQIINSCNFFIEEVKKQVKENFIDLIIMGTKGVSGLDEIILGSNTSNLITQVKCPVLIVPEKAVFKTPEEIAFPTDYNVFYPTAILNNIAEIANMYKSAIRILHIVNNNDDDLTAFQLENKAYLHEFFSNKNHSFHKITNNKIEKGVQCFVESRNTDMIVMIAKNINLFQRILFKPIVEEISYHVEIPFLVLHEQNI
jgi:nucleotide-binding universal stress UspA family protein